MDSENDDIPLRKRNQAFLLGKTKPVVLDSSDDGSPLPSWLNNHKSPIQQGGFPAQSDSDSEVREVMSPVKLLSPSKKQESQPEEAVLGVCQPKPPSATNKKSSSAEKPTLNPITVGKLSSSHKTAAPKAGTEPVQIRGPPSAIPPSLGVPAPSSSLPVVFPEKLSQAKVILELESTDEVHGATDLSGDSGAIGRVMVTGQPGAQQVQIDLKGVLYNATIVPCPVTMAVVNIGQNEAKVECLFSEFAQLREDTRFANIMGGGGASGGLLGDDDDDEEYYAADGNGDDGASNGKTKNKKKGAAVVAKKPRGGGSRKPAAKRPKPKGKPKPRAKK